jgi:hypothetical protein
MFIKKAKMKIVNPTALHIIPPIKPRFSTDVESAKWLKQEGSPITIEKPKKRTIKALANIPLLETVVKSNVAIVPVNGHKYSSLARARAKNFEPSIAETATPT